jgi:very-short-patch-repair endonuclease
VVRAWQPWPWPKISPTAADRSLHRDFFCAEKKLVIEIDGEQHALGDHPERDRERTQWLEAHGYIVIRFWTNEVMHQLDGVCEAILAASHGEWRYDPPPETG